MLPMRLYTAGIADFEKIRQNNRIYVDKTDLIYRMTHESDFVFLSRPRRFGKSLLCSTLKYYFQGRKDLFEGLAIAELEKDWKQHPVLHFDMSTCKYKRNIQEIVDELHSQLDYQERKYKKEKTEGSPGMRFKNLIQSLHNDTGLKTVVILDEYDSPMLDYLHKHDMLEEVRHIMQEFYQMVKACDADEQFVFITGITKFSQLSIFSTLNNLRNISMEPAYAALCGITKEELLTIFDEDIQMVADRYKQTKEWMIDRLKLDYDGYHFCGSSPDIFNPYSLMNVFVSQRLDYYWFGSGTPTFLFEEMKRFNTNLLELEQLQVPSTQFDVPTEGMTSALPMLYQSGYLTIKDYDMDTDLYTLDFPNAEVKVGFMDNFLVRMMNLGNTNSRGFAGNFYAALLRHDIDERQRLLRLRIGDSTFEGTLRKRGNTCRKQQPDCHPQCRVSTRPHRCGGFHARRHLCDGTENARHSTRSFGTNRQQRLRHTLSIWRQTCYQNRHRLLEGNQDRFGLDYRERLILLPLSINDSLLRPRRWKTPI